MRNQFTRLLVGSLFILSSTTAFARPARKHAPKLAAIKPTVSMQDARKTAVERIPGTIKSEELEKEHGRWIYSFIIRPTDGKPGRVNEVNVDAMSGKVVAVEIERG